MTEPQRRMECRAEKGGTGGCRIELHETPDGYRLALVNHKLRREMDAVSRPKAEAFALAKQAKEFLDWPVWLVTRE